MVKKIENDTPNAKNAETKKADVTKKAAKASGTSTTTETATATATATATSKGASSTKGATKENQAPVTALGVATVVDDAPVADNAIDESASISGSKSAALLIDMQARVQQLQSAITMLKGDMRTFARVSAKETKILEKSSGRKNKKNTVARQPSGFVKPTPISDELALFLNKDKGIEMARTDVTREINAYIRAHSLQDQANGRKINADSKLSKLLKLEKTDELTYFNLQKFMSRHFYKAAAKEAATNTIVAN